MSPLIADLLDHLTLERLEENLFRGDSRDVGGHAVFGGQVLAQAAVAAGMTVEGRPVHSLHGYFLRPGDVQSPIVYDVDRIRDGGSFSTRRVVAIQHGRAIFNMSASFHAPEPGVDHQVPMPKVPPPEELVSTTEFRRGFADRLPERLRGVLLQERPVEFRPVEHLDPLQPPKRPPNKQVWIRASGPLPDDPGIHQAVLAYASDFSLLSTVFLPHGLSFFQREVRAMSLDHAMWFHRPLRMDDWLLYSMDSPSACGGLGLSRGSIFSRDGVLVASVAQEGLIRKG